MNSVFFFEVFVEGNDLVIPGFLTGWLLRVSFKTHIDSFVKSEGGCLGDSIS